jgi:hypothetical protein
MPRSYRSLKKLLFFNFYENRFFDSLWKTLVLQKTKHPHKKGVQI